MTVAEALRAALEHHQAGRLQAAEALYLRVLSLQPDHSEALHFLGVIAYQSRKLEDAARLLERAIAADPSVATYYHHLGVVEAARGRLDEALAGYRKALQLAPDLAEAHNGMGNALKDRGRIDEAIACYRGALALKPALVESHSNLGNVLELKGLRGEAAECYRRALELKPDYADAHWNLALLNLLMGDFQRGWEEYEWRWKTNWMRPRAYAQPRWNGERFDGKTILLHCEQGLGDTIQFVRYAPLVKARGGEVIVECQKPLLRLLAGCPGVDRLVGEGDELPRFDLFAPLLGLPRIFRTDIESVPADTGYVGAPPALAEHWRARLSRVDGFKIGIGWQGNASYPKDRYRSVPLEHFAALAAVPGVRLVSLQKTAGTEQLNQVRDRFPVIDLSAELDEDSGPFMDTAAIVSNLDLTITSDTALAHLAGAMGAPVWVALAFAPDWRWLLERSDSPWYPSMRLFRQKTLGNWSEVFEAIRGALRALVG